MGLRNLVGSSLVVVSLFAILSKRNRLLQSV